MPPRRAAPPVPAPLDPLGVCARQCGARCCRYLTVTIPPPRTTEDWDEMRWWLAHGGVMVSRDAEGWMLHVETRCRHLGADNACGIYTERMDTCAEYDAQECEYVNPVAFPLELRSEADLAAWIERRGLKRGAPVARRIRAAARRRDDDQADRRVRQVAR